MTGVMIVTGASGGVGRAVVRRFARRFEILAVARRGDRMRELFADLESVTPVAADLSDPKAAWEAVAARLEGRGPVTHLINNAGVLDRGRTEELEAGTLRQAFIVNVEAPLYFMGKAIPLMRSGGFGRIVNVSSGAPFLCRPEFSAYSGTKAALNAVTVTCARENEDLNLKINLMSPGYVRTGMSPAAELAPEVCLPTFEYLVDLPADGPTGGFFWHGWELPVLPAHEGVDWSAGTADRRYRKVVT